ncbi:hypothetical protein O9929_16770 [Vibrio lentus]|nr:hypothetical protein [Vibrio lentus]
MSNRGRQLAASFDLRTRDDWRHGACFESQLIDYDVASTWGNWAYIAGALNSQVKHPKLTNSSECQSKHNPNHTISTCRQ